MINNKITKIASLITDAQVVVDVGCDHCYLAIELLSNHRCQHVINIDLRPKPLSIGEKNLLKFHLLEQTTNLVHDGLKQLSLAQLQIPFVTTTIDYAVVAGMGSSNIIHILKENSLPIQTWILHPTKKEYQLREYLVQNGYAIVEEHYLSEHDIYYPLLVVRKSPTMRQYSREDLYFGKINHIKDSSIYYAMLKDKRHFLETTYANKWHQVDPQLQEEYQLLLQRINKYENQ